MKHIKTFCLVSLMTFFLSLGAFAGGMDTPGVAAPPTPTPTPTPMCGSMTPGNSDDAEATSEASFLYIVEIYASIFSAIPLP